MSCLARSSSLQGGRHLRRASWHSRHLAAIDQGARDDLSDILHRETAGRVPTRGILEHLDAERAFRCDDRGTRCARFTHANDSGLLLARDAIPVLGTARATAEAPLPIPRHLDDLE